MQRRNFILGILAGSTLVPQVFSNTIKKSFLKRSTEVTVNCLECSEIKYANRMTINLPKNPVPFETIIRFQTRRTKWEKSPIIVSSTHLINGKKGPINIDDEYNLKTSTEFSVQFLGEDFGWNII